MRVDNVTVTYRNAHTAIKDASFSLPEGSITALVGMNGSGKSTLFKSIMGFLSLTAGSIQIFGSDVKKSLKNNAISYVPQSEEIDWNFPVLVEDVVMMGRFGHMNLFRIPRAFDNEIVDFSLKQVGMLSLRKRQIGELSGGQKKRVFIARALAQESRVILLDEPFTGVDVQTEEQIMDLLKKMREDKKVILVSTHNLGSVPEFCDRSVLINKTIIASGLTSEVFTQENLYQAFGGVLRRFVLGGKELHADDDLREVSVFTDDERPFVTYGKHFAGKRIPVINCPITNN